MQVGVAGILDVVPEVPLDIADVARVEIHRDSIRARVEHRHGAFALNPVLPFVGVGVPVHFAQGTGMDRQQRGGYRRGDGEVSAVGDAHYPASRLSRRGHRSEREGERVGWSVFSAHRCPVRGEIARHLALKYPEIVQRNARKRLGRYPEVFSENGGRRMGKPVRYQQSVELTCMAIVEADDEFASVRAKALEGMRIAGGEIPKVPFFHVRDIGSALWIQHGDPAIAVSHERPLGRLMPMQFAYAASRKPHIDA